ncbi:hypothetical protein Leryth_022409 [Lithospermum erythrorhizon]|nr:hypothetical protein Leryth_022409 [Lithospermum erythrorhizon]
MILTKYNRICYTKYKKMIRTALKSPLKSKYNKNKLVIYNIYINVKSPYSGMAFNCAINFPFLRPPTPLLRRLFTTTSLPRSRCDAFIVCFSVKINRLLLRHPHFSPPPHLAKTVLAFTANAAISSAFIRRFNHLNGSAKYNCPSCNNSSSFIADTTSLNSMSSELHMKC